MRKLIITETKTQIKAKTTLHVSIGEGDKRSAIEPSVVTSSHNETDSYKSSYKLTASGTV